MSARSPSSINRPCLPGLHLGRCSALFLRSSTGNRRMPPDGRFIPSRIAPVVDAPGFSTRRTHRPNRQVNVRPRLGLQLPGLTRTFAARLFGPWQAQPAPASIAGRAGSWRSADAVSGSPETPVRGLYLASAEASPATGSTELREQRLPRGPGRAGHARAACWYAARPPAPQYTGDPPMVRASPTRSSKWRLSEGIATW